MKVCVVGAGVAGLCAARWLAVQPSVTAITVLELTSAIGGTWNYVEKVGKDVHGNPIHSSMYKNLRTNLPKQTMELPGFPMPKEMPSFPSAAQFEQYLIDFSEHFSLHKFIQFEQLVTKVTKLENPNTWKVVWRDLRSDREQVGYFDAVAVCSGHFSKPHIPKFTGDEKFQGKLLHSHDYRAPETYAGQKVLIIGAGPSGVDLVIDMAPHCLKVIISHRKSKPLATLFPRNVTQKPDIREITQFGAVFVDDSFEDVDVIILCTGYEYYYPFLDKSCELTVKATHVTPLYRHLVNINQPTMIMIGLPQRVCAVINIDTQAQYVARLLGGHFQLPSKSNMMQALAEEIRAREALSLPESQTHVLEKQEIQYLDSLSFECGCPRVTPALVRVREFVKHVARRDLYTYRQYDFQIIDKDNFTKIYVDHQKG